MTRTAAISEYTGEKPIPGHHPRNFSWSKGGRRCGRRPWGGGDGNIDLCGFTLWNRRYCSNFKISEFIDTKTECHCEKECRREEYLLPAPEHFQRWTIDLLLRFQLGKLGRVLMHHLGTRQLTVEHAFIEMLDMDVIEMPNNDCQHCQDSFCSMSSLGSWNEISRQQTCCGERVPHHKTCESHTTSSP